MQILGLVGSLRAESYNRRLMKAVIDRAPDGMTIEVFDGLRALPHYDADLALDGDPPAVAAWKEAVVAADGLVIVTPEYSFGIPGFLKNALDWAATPVGRSVLRQKPTAIMGATNGPLGTMLAQQQLRQVLLATDTPVVSSPNVLFSQASERLDADGVVSDDRLSKLIARLLVNLATLVEKTPLTA